jgi:hypothetical protein
MVHSITYLAAIAHTAVDLSHRFQENRERLSSDDVLYLIHVPIQCFCRLGTRIVLLCCSWGSDSDDFER